MLKNNENIVFGKMDGTANDIPYMFPPIKVSQSKNLTIIFQYNFFHFRASLQCSSSLHMKSMIRSSIKGTGPTSQSRIGSTGNMFTMRLRDIVDSVWRKGKYLFEFAYNRKISNL